jgi:serine protease Do
VGVQDSDRGLEVHDDSKAQELGIPLRKGDIILDIQDRRTPDHKTYAKLLQPEAGIPIAYPGDPVCVRVKRGTQTMEFRFRLFLLGGGQFPENRSPRWYGFPKVFDTEIPLKPTQCGGPLIDVRGRIMGIVIACSQHPSESSAQVHVIPAAVAEWFVTSQ